MRLGSGHHTTVALLEPGMGEGQAPECVGGQWIDARLIEDDLGLEGEDAGEDSFERVQIFRVARAVFELDIDLAALLAKRKI